MVPIFPSPEAKVAERFKRDTADHTMTVLHDNGLYRHLRFRNPRTSEYWFDIVTWPGSLAMRGDVGDGYVFTRLPDMFEFFRGKRINPHYWAEKLGGGRRSVQEYSENLLRQIVVERFVEDARWGGVPAGTGKALRTWVLNEDLSDERHARNVLEDFAHKGYEFSDVWEWSFQDYELSFLWACHAIVWGIGQYDAAGRERDRLESQTSRPSYPPLWIADYEGAELTLHLTREAAQAACDDYAKAEAHGRYYDWRTEEDDIDRQFWTHPDDDSPVGYTGGEVWQIEVESPSEACAATPAPGELAEQRHLLYDADPDSTVPPLVDIHRHKTTRRGNR